MKKYLFFLSAISMTLFTACTKDDLAKEMSPEEKNAAIIAEATAASDVQIRLGFGSQSNNTSITRAPIESDNDGIFSITGSNDDYLGIYCLAQQPQTPTASPGPVQISEIDWSTNDDESLMFLMNKNQPARVAILNPGDKLGNVTVTAKTSDVQFMDLNTIGEAELNNRLLKHYYYPYGNWYNYYFYAYYPRQASGNITETANKITVDFTLDGTQDIIYAKAMPAGDDANTGYNAKYLRDKQDLGGVNNLEDLPSLTLDHKLAQLRFYVQCKSPNYITYGYGEDIGASAPYKKLFQLKELALTKVPVKWQLVLADREHPTTATVQGNEGKLEHVGTITGGKVDETDGSLLQKLNVKTMSIDAGVVTATNVDALSAAVNIPYTGSEVTYWKIVSEENTPKWVASDKAAYDEADNNSNAVDLSATSIRVLPDAELIAGNVGKYYKIWCDFDDDSTIDLATGEPLLVGYAMIPTTEMMGDMVIDNRGTQSKNPYITFTLNAGKTNGDANGTDWEAASQAIAIPTGGFEAGKVYNVILNIPVPEEMHMSATLPSWVVVPVSDETETGQNINMTVD